MRRRLFHPYNVFAPGTWPTTCGATLATLTYVMSMLKVQVPKLTRWLNKRNSQAEPNVWVGQTSLGFG